jgi:WD40 repeat protein
VDVVVWLRVGGGGGGYAAAVRCVCEALERTGMSRAAVREVVLGAPAVESGSAAGFMQAALGYVVAVARARFAGRRVLVVLECGDGAPAGAVGDPGDLVAVFGEVLAAAAPPAVLLVCTEYAAVAARADSSVRFSDVVEDPAAARHIFHMHAEGGDADSLTELGGGVPLAIALAGRVARVAGPAARAVLTRALPPAALEIADRVAEDGEVPLPFARLLARVLDMLDGGLLDFSPVLPSGPLPPAALAYSWSHMYLALAVVEAEAPLSFPVLSRLWNVPARDAVQAAVDVFVMLGLASFDDGRLYMHPGHIACCRAYARCDAHAPSEAVWHLRLCAQLALAPCLAPGAGEDVASTALVMRKRVIAAHNVSRLLNVPADICSVSDGGPLSQVPWWRLCSDGVAGALDATYFATNIVRHLVSAAGGLGAGIALLADYRYLDVKCTGHGLDAVKADFRELLRAARSTRSALADDGDAALIDSVCGDAHLILQSLDLMPVNVTGSGASTCLSVFGVEDDIGDEARWCPSAASADQGLANQLIGRLPRHTSLVSAGRVVSRANLVARLRKSVFEHARRPWLRPLTPHLEQAGGGLERVIRLGSGTITSVAVSGDIVVSGTVSGNLFIHDIATGRVLRELSGHKSHVHSVSISEDDPRRIVSSSWDRTVRIWDAQTGRCLCVLAEHTDQVFCTATTASGACVASGSMDKTVMVWRDGLAVGASLHILDGHTDWVRSVALTSSGALVFSGGDDTTVRVWAADPHDPTMMSCYQVLRGHRSRVSCLAVTSDDRLLVSGSFDGSIRVWTIETGTLRQAFDGPGGKRVLSIAAPHGSGTLVAGYDDGCTRVYALQGRRRGPVAEFGDGLMAGRLAVSKEGRKVVSCSLDGALRVWSTPPAASRRTGGEAAVPSSAPPLMRRSQELHTRPVSAIAASSDGSLVASGSWDKDIRLWCVATGRCERVLTGHAHAVSALAFTENGAKLASGCRDESIRIWSVPHGRCEQTLVGHKAPIACLAVNQNGSRLLSGCEAGTVRLWDAATRYATDKPLRRYHVPVLSVALSWNGSIAVALSANGACMLWDVSRGAAALATCLSSVKFASFRFGPSTAPAMLAAYSLKRGLPLSAVDDGSGLVSSGTAAGYKCSPSKRGPGLEVSWTGKAADGTSSSSGSESAEDGGLAPHKQPAPAKAGHEPHTAPAAASTVAYMDSGMGREQRVWTPVFTNASGQKFVSAGLCTGAVAILELVE